MKLDVPIHRQKKDSVNCGTVCLKMLTDYYNVGKSLKEIESEINVSKDGTWAGQIGSYLISQGFDVEIITKSPYMFTQQDVDLSQEELSKKLEEMKSILGRYSETYVRHYVKESSKHFSQFIDNGGKITLKIPKPSDVRKEIKNNRPVISLLTSNFLSMKSRPAFNRHYNVVTGIDKKRIYVNDPADSSMGGKHDYPIDDYFYGIYSHGAGLLMKIKRRI